MADTLTHMVLPDLHMPYHDKALVEVWLQHAEVVAPDTVHIIGDLIDCYSLSRFDKDPSRREHLQDELDQATAFLRRLREVVPKCNIEYSEGNHEDRLRKMLWKSTGALAPLRGLRIPSLLSLDELEIRYHPILKPYHYGPVWFTHGDITGTSTQGLGGGKAGAYAKQRGVSIVMGHTHKMGFTSWRGWNGIVEGYEVGCLCKFDMGYIVGQPPWQQGWATVQFPKGARGFEVKFARVLQASKRRKEIIYNGDLLATVPSR